MPGDMAMWVLKDVFLNLKAWSVSAQTLCDPFSDRKLWQVATELVSLCSNCREFLSHSCLLQLETEQAPVPCPKTAFPWFLMIALYLYMCPKARRWSCVNPVELVAAFHPEQLWLTFVKTSLGNAEGCWLCIGVALRPPAALHCSSSCSVRLADCGKCDSLPTKHLTTQ